MRSCCREHPPLHKDLEAHLQLRLQEGVALAPLDGGALAPGHKLLVVLHLSHHVEQLLWGVPVGRVAAVLVCEGAQGWGMVVVVGGQVVVQCQAGICSWDECVHVLTKAGLSAITWLGLWRWLVGRRV